MSQRNMRSAFNNSKKTSRTPPTGPGISRAISSCQSCEETDTEDMVQCDICDKWQHFTCAVVTESIAEKDFTCDNCKLPNAAVEDNNSVRNSSIASKNSGSSVKRKAMLKLQKLEEEKAAEKQFLDKKYEILSDLISDDEELQPTNEQPGKSKYINSWVANSSASALLSIDSTVKSAHINTDHLTEQPTESFTVPNTNTQTVCERPVISASTNSTLRSDGLLNCRLSTTRPITTVTQHTESHKYIIDSGNSFHNCKLPFINTMPVSLVTKTNVFAPRLESNPPVMPCVFPPVTRSVKNQCGSAYQSAFRAPPVDTCNTSSATLPVPSVLVNQCYSAPQPAIRAPNIAPGDTYNAFSANQTAFSVPNNGFRNPCNITSAPQFLQNNNNDTISRSAATSSCHPGASYNTSERSSINIPRIICNPPSDLHNCGQPAINKNQLAARQVMPKDLPIFSGNPYDWPVFISSFEGSTRICGFTNEENLYRLQRCLKGKALEAVRCRLLLPQTVPQVIETLRLLYGRPEVVIQSLLQIVRNQPPPKAERLETLISYALSVQNLCSTIEASGLVDHLCNPTLLQELVEKLPSNIKLYWAMYKQSVSYVTLAVLGNWLFQIAQAASEVTIPHFNISPETRSFKDRGFVHTHLEGSESNHDSQVLSQRVKFESLTGNQTSIPSLNRTQRIDPQRCVVCGDDNHCVENCDTFKGLKHFERWGIVKQNKLCRKCLKQHSQVKCKVERTCGQNGCPYRHHPLLHNYNYIEGNSKLKLEVSPIHQNNTHQQSRQTTLFRILPVILHGKFSSIKTYAFLDEGSSVTLIDDDIANELALGGTKEKLCLRWTADNVRVEPDSKRLSLEISGSYDNAKTYKMDNVRTVKKLSLPKQSISLRRDEKYNHLQDIPFESYKNAVTRILIGIDNWRLGLPLEVREGNNKDLVATKTRLGWEVHGLSGGVNFTDQPTIGYHHNSFHVCDCSPKDDLHQLVKDFFSIESIGVKIPDVMPASKDNVRAINIMNSTTRKTINRFETGLLWRYDNLTLPDSYQMAYRRFLCLEKQISRNPTLGQRIERLLREYLEKGYVRKLSAEELNMYHPRIWYLPLFTVTNPNKPEKLRIVWDAAAQAHGVSLNSVLLKGPDELTPLLDVLFKFRERAIAVTGDIREMFHQVRIRNEDQQSQRFLWKNRDENQLSVYVVQVMTFGAACSPSSAQYVKNLNASQFSNRFPKAAEAIVANHYVDDMLTSAETVEEAIMLAKQVRYIHSKAGFEIRNWASNSPDVLKELGENKENKLEKIMIKKESEPEVENVHLLSMSGNEKILGMLWCTSEDTFLFPLMFSRVNHDVLTRTRSPTKREVLRTLMSIFDPLGLLSPFVVCGKILLKDIWRSLLDWDDQLTGELYLRWQKWVQYLEHLKELRIPRCYSSKSSAKQRSIQLHVFVDASEFAYAAVAYFGIETDTGIDCSLIAGKTKVTPQKPISIPRLELQAAVLGTRLANYIIIDKKFMWTDSRTVLCWLRSDPTKYRQFVAFRIGEILETTNIIEWYWVPTKQNVADDATKTPSSGLNFTSNSRWFTGPTFLGESEDRWPANITIEDSSIEELRPHFIQTLNQTDRLIELERFSKWLRLVRTMAYVYRFTRNAKRKSQRALGPLTKDEYQLAQNKLYQIAQFECYAEEILVLRRNRSLEDGQQSSIRGCCGSTKKRTIVGGWAWAWWLVTDVQRLSLEVMTLNPMCEGVETAQGVPLTVTGVAQCKIMKADELLGTASEQFLGKSVKEIKQTILQTLEGHLRAILGTLTVEEVYKDRDQFAALVREVAAPDVGRMGIEILSFTIKDVYDDVQYLASLGKAQTASVKRDADAGVAEANRDAGIREAECEKSAMDVKYSTDTKIEDNARMYKLQKAHFDQEINTAKAESQLAYELQAAKIKQKIRNEEIQIDVVERRKQIEIESQEIQRRERELNATVRLPAEAESYRVQTIAQGKQSHTIEAARAESEKIKQIGLAEAHAIKLVGKAEAERMKMKAAVYKQYGDAAIMSIVLESLPKIAAEIAAPLAKTDEIVLIGGNDSTTADVTRLVSQLPPAINALTGVDLSKVLSKIPGAKA